MMAIVTSGFIDAKRKFKNGPFVALGQSCCFFNNSKERMQNFKITYAYFVKTTRFRWLTLTCDRRVSRQGFPEFLDKQGKRNFLLHPLNGSHNRLLPYLSLKERKAQVSRMQVSPKRKPFFSLFHILPCKFPSFTSFLSVYILLKNSEQRLHRVPGYHVMQLATSRWRIPRCPRLNGLTLLVELNKISVQMEGLVRITDILKQKLVLFPTQVDLRDFDW